MWGKKSFGVSLGVHLLFLALLAQATGVTVVTGSSHLMSIELISAKRARHRQSAGKVSTRLLTDVSVVSAQRSEAPTSPVVAQSGHFDAKDEALAFLADLRSLIEREKEYPAVARARRQSGTVEVTFKLLKSGEITSVRILKPSGFTRLDEAAIATVVRVGKFRPVPDAVSLTDFGLTLPITFLLN